MKTFLRVFLVLFFFLFLLPNRASSEADPCQQPPLNSPPPIYYLINNQPVQEAPELWDCKNLNSGRNPDKTFPPLRIDGLAGSVIVTFRGIGLTPGSTYHLCGKFDPRDCALDKSATIKDFKAQPATGGSGGEINIRVCGAGQETLKGHGVDSSAATAQNTKDTLNTPDSGCSSKNDWFHEGHVYELHLFQDLNGQALLATAQFFVIHSFPVIKIAPASGEKFSPDAPIKLYLWGRRPYGDSQNNYHIKLTGDDNNLEIDRCSQGNTNKDIVPPEASGETVGIDTQWVDEHSDTGTNTEHAGDILSGAGWGIQADSLSNAAVTTLGQGKDFNLGIGDSTNNSFTLEVNERVHEGRPLGIGGGSCQGDYTYMRVHFMFDNTTNSGIKITGVEYDPDASNNSDRERKGAFAAAFAPCAEMDGQNRCTAVNTAIGTINTTPAGFVDSMFKFVLMLAGFGGIIIIIYSGYMLMTSQGDKEKLSAARETLTSAILGLLFIVLSIVILEIIGVDILRIPGFGR